MQLTDKDGNVFGIGGLEITTSDGKPKIPVINTDITIGVTSIVSGTVGRILFEGAGNVVQESANLFWDNVNGRLGLGGTPGAFTLDVTGTSRVQGNTTLGNTSFFSGGFTGITSIRKDLSITAGGTYRNGQLAVGSVTNDGAVVIGYSTTGVGFLQAAVMGVTFSPLTLQPSSGNVLVGTTTDAGFRFDVAGTIRSQGSLFISNPSFTMGGSITHSANATLVIAGGPGGGENITIGPSNRIFINAQQSRFPNGSVQMASTLTVGSTNATSTNMLLMGGSITAGSGVGRGIGLDTGLVQSAANDVLTALHVNPTFTVNNTLFHEAYWMRLTGSYTPASYTGNNNATGIDLSNSFTNTFNAIGIRIRHTYGNVQNGYGILLESAGYIGIAQTSTASRNFLAGQTNIGATVTGSVGNSATLNVLNGTNGGIKVGSLANNNQHLVISHSEGGATFASIRSTFNNTGASMLIDVAGQNNLRLFGTGNVAINNSTDAGFKLDVNGATRVQGVITGSVSAGGLTLGAASANQVGIALNGYFVSSGAISTSNFNARSFNHIIGGQGAGIVSTFNGLAQGLTTNCEYFVARGNINLTDGAIDLSGYSFAPTIVSEVGATIKAFSSSLSAASNRWNLFLSGTAKNYIAGNVLIGTTTDTGYKLNVNGGGYFESNLKVNGAITATIPTANTYVCNIGLAADQSIPSLSDTQINFVDIDDTNNWYDPTTKRFTPTIAGYYHVDFTVWFDPATVTTAQYNVQIRKNASTVLIIQQPTINNGTGQSLTGSKLIYFNGTTDYIDFTAYQSTGVNRNLQKGAADAGTYASIHLLAI
jgi:hypothetical protein